MGLTIRQGLNCSTLWERKAYRLGFRQRYKALKTWVDVQSLEVYEALLRAKRERICVLWRSEPELARLENRLDDLYRARLLQRCGVASPVSWGSRFEY